MKLIEQLCFHGAVKITGELTRDDGAVLRYTTQHDLGWQWHCPTGCARAVTEWEVANHWREHFREWLEERRWFIAPWRSRVGYCAVHIETRISMFTDDSKTVQAKNYLECLCLAVIECDKKERGDG